MFIQGAFLMRGLANVRGEFSLTALAYKSSRGEFRFRRRTDSMRPLTA